MSHISMAYFSYIDTLLLETSYNQKYLKLLVDQLLLYEPNVSVWVARPNQSRLVCQ